MAKQSPNRLLCPGRGLSSRSYILSSHAFESTAAAAAPRADFSAAARNRFFAAVTEQRKEWNGMECNEMIEFISRRGGGTRLHFGIAR